MAGNVILVSNSGGVLVLQSKPHVLIVGVPGPVGNMPISPDEGNIIQARQNGLYASAASTVGLPLSSDNW